VTIVPSTMTTVSQKVHASIRVFADGVNVTIVRHSAPLRSSLAPLTYLPDKGVSVGPTSKHVTGGSMLGRANPASEGFGTVRGRRQVPSPSVVVGRSSNQ
jgi:hypothetical protein